VNAGPRARVTADEYASARAAYLAEGTAEAVQRAIGCGPEVAARLIMSGEPRLLLPSLQDAARAYAAELTKNTARTEKATAAVEATSLAHTLEARARAAKAARATEEKVLGDALTSRTDEVKLVRANRTSALVLARVNADLLQLSVHVGASLLKEKDAITKLGVKDRLGILRTIAGIVQRTADASRVSVNMERLLMGEPTAILGREGSSGPSTGDMTAEEAEQWLGIANRAFARRAARRSAIETTGEVVEESPTTEPDELYEELEQ